MKKNHFLSLFFITICFSCRAAETNFIEWGSESGNTRISIQLKNGNQEIKTNQPIKLMVRIENLSTNKTIGFEKSVIADVASAESSVPVLSVSNNDPYVYIDNGGSFSGSASLAKVSPNGHYDFKLDLGHLKKYSTNTVYKVLVKRKTVSGQVVISNPLYLKVVAGEWTNSDPDLEMP